jgi:SulP family sulfate permease
MFVTTISVLLNITGVEVATKREADLDRELNVLGFVNLLTAAFGGYVACVTGTRTRMNFTLGGDSRVSGLIIAAMSGRRCSSIRRIKQAADALGARLVLINLTPSIAKAFQNIRFISEDIAVIPELDRALEFCENEIIAVHSKDDDAVRSLRDWLAIALGNADHAEALAVLCQRLEFAAGDLIAQQGDASDSMHFILQGRAGIIVNLADGRSVRVRSLGPQTIIGEMGLITGRPRSATVQAEVASIAYALPAEPFERLKSEHPALAQALLTYVIGVLAERLSFASRVIGILQR